MGFAVRVPMPVGGSAAAPSPACPDHVVVVASVIPDARGSGSVRLLPEVPFRFSREVV